MNKIQLRIVIDQYRKSLWLFESEDIRITLLDEFLQTPYVQQAEVEHEFSFADFLAYLRSYDYQPEHLFNLAFLSGPDFMTPLIDMLGAIECAYYAGAPWLVGAVVMKLGSNSHALNLFKHMYGVSELNDVLSFLRKKGIHYSAEQFDIINKDIHHYWSVLSALNEDKSYVRFLTQAIFDKLCECHEHIKGVAHLILYVNENDVLHPNHLSLFFRAANLTESMYQSLPRGSHLTLFAPHSPVQNDRTAADNYLFNIKDPAI